MANVEEKAQLVIEAAKIWARSQGDRPVLNTDEWALWVALNDYKAAERDNERAVVARS